MALTKNRAVLDWIDQMAAMTQPDQIIWIDGTEAQLEDLRAQACATGDRKALGDKLAFSAARKRQMDLPGPDLLE